MSLPELLAPVGSIDHLKLAIFSGASSIYLSGKKFGARKYAKNFSLSEIESAVKFAHLHNVKVYVTVNTLIKDNELFEVADYVFKLYKCGIDGILVQDIGLLKVVKYICPNLNIHASTQMNIHNIEGIKWAKEQGISRIVLPRELTYNEVKEMVDFAHSVGIEIEIFLHGALCYSYSGRCLLSSLIGNRSGNRGTCAQPCRQKYQISIDDVEYNKINILSKINSKTNIKTNSRTNSKINSKTSTKTNNLKVNSNQHNGEYLISPKDLSLFDHLPKLIDLGVDSLKIEGRMRSKEYITIVVSQYRQALNQLKGKLNFNNKNKNINKNNTNKSNSSNISKNYKNYRNHSSHKYHDSFKDNKYYNSKENLGMVFNRGFTSGHFLTKNNQKLINRRKPGHVGLFVGNVSNFNPKLNEISISLKKGLINIPERGDGILIESFDGDYGFEISNNPVLDVNKKNNQKYLLVKLVKENNNVNVSLKQGDNIYLTKRKKLNDLTKNMLHNNDKKSFKKSIVSIKFSIDSQNSDSLYFPVLEANVILGNGKKLNFIDRSDDSWELARNKPITTNQLKKQLLKIGDLPFYIDNIDIFYSGNLFTPLSKINEFRRDFFNKLEILILNSYIPDDNDLNISKNRLKDFKRNFINISNIINSSSNEININNSINNSNINSNNNISNKSDISNYNNINNSNIDSNIINKTNHHLDNNKVVNESFNIINESSNNKTSKYSVSAYINDLEILKNISNNDYGETNFNRLYLEVPVENDFLESKPIDVSYYIMFLKEALNISNNQKYELVWKWPDIAHKDTKEGLIKIVGILKKLNIKLNIMTSFLGMNSYLKDNYSVNIYGSYALNVFNSISASNLKDFVLLTFSPELSINDLKTLMDNYEVKNPVPEVLVKGNIETLITRKPFIDKKHYSYINSICNNNPKFNFIKDKSINDINFYLDDLKNNFYPIKSVEGGNLILNSRETSLEDQIPRLVSFGINNFSIDARWKSKDYLLNLKL